MEPSATCASSIRGAFALWVETTGERMFVLDGEKRILTILSDDLKHGRLERVSQLMPYIETAPGTRKIAWTQDFHGQWSSGDLEVRPIVAKHGPVCWNLFLGGECIGRSYGYSRPGVAKATAPLLKSIRDLFHGKATEPPFQEIRGAVIDLVLLAQRIARATEAEKRQELLVHAVRVGEKVGCGTAGILRETTGGNDVIG